MLNKSERQWGVSIERDKAVLYKAERQKVLEI